MCSFDSSVVAVNCFTYIWVVRSCVDHQTGQPYHNRFRGPLFLWFRYLLLYLLRDGRSRAHIAIRVFGSLEHFYCLYSSVYKQTSLKCNIEHMWKFPWISWQFRVSKQGIHLDNLHFCLQSAFIFEGTKPCLQRRKIKGDYNIQGHPTRI